MKQNFKYDRMIRALGLLVTLLLSPAAKSALDPALTGAWYDQRFDGAGFFVEVLANDQAVVYWFTYDDDGNQRWYIGIGDAGDNAIVIDDFFRPEGARFGDKFDSEDITMVPAGLATLEFPDCNTGRIEFQADGLASTQQLTRLTHIRDLDCAGASALPSKTTRQPVNQTGSWYNPERSGEGFIVEVLDDNRVLVTWFTYDPDGNQAWLIGVGHAAEDYIHVSEMSIAHNGRFGPDHDPDAVVMEPWGSLELRLDCGQGTFVYDSDQSAWGHGQHSLSRLTKIDGLECSSEPFGPVQPAKLVGSWLSDGFGMAARVDSQQFSLFQLTSSSCLEVMRGPAETLSTLGEELVMTAGGDRLRFSGLDSLVPVEFNRTVSLPSNCLGGGAGISGRPQDVFASFADTFSELYSAFEVRGVDWETAREMTAPRILPGLSDNALFSELASMLVPLNDGHVTLQAPFAMFAGGGNAEQTALINRSRSPLTDQIIGSRLSGSPRTEAGGLLRYGMTHGGHGYLEILKFRDFLSNSTEQDTLAYLRPIFDRIFRFFKDNGARGLVLDVRRNDGGNMNYGLEIAGRLNRGVTRQILSERRITPAGLNTAIALTLEPVSGEQFDGPVAILTSSLTASAAEIFAMAIRTLPHARLFGQRSLGVLSRSDRLLPNHWIVSITAGQVESPTGEQYEAVGIPVDHETSVFSAEDLNQSIDPALDSALEWLDSAQSRP